MSILLPNNDYAAGNAIDGEVIVATEVMQLALKIPPSMRISARMKVRANEPLIRCKDTGFQIVTELLRPSCVIVLIPRDIHAHSAFTTIDRSTSGADRRCPDGTSSE